MIDASLLLSDLRAELGRFVTDLYDRVKSDEEVQARLESEWHSAFNAHRTGRTFEDWTEDRLTQVAVAWLLAFVFIRFCEDSGLITEAGIAGSGDRGAEARVAQQSYFAALPNSNDREYLQSVFRESAKLRGLDGVVGEDESPLWLVDPPADTVRRVIDLFRATDESGKLVHDFTDPDRDTRFLGDLYQDLSDYAKSNYALLQTPVFVEEFILDRTLTPAIETFGLAKTTLIDPTCGSGHFLLGGFHRIFEAWRAAEPGGSEREHAERALAAVTGVDLNPFAAAIARFRLLVAALKASHVTRLADAPAFVIDVAVGDSLLWGARPGQFAGMEEANAAADSQFLYKTEHSDALRRIFNKQYTAVVGNPPYIICQDPVLNHQYRHRYPIACSGRYSLSAPFMQCFMELCLSPDGNGSSAGFMGQITANSFMKQSFGRKLVEQLIPRWDLTCVVDASGAYIPGHATPTVIICGRHQLPICPTVRTVMSIRGEPVIPVNPARGLVWTAIVDQVDKPGSESEHVSVSDVDRLFFGSHPWSIGGGGAAELKQELERRSLATLGSICESIGITAVTGEDEVFIAGTIADRERKGFAEGPQLIVGKGVRDWGVYEKWETLWPYDNEFDVVHYEHLNDSERTLLWTVRSAIDRRRRFGVPMVEKGLKWWEWQELYVQKLKVKLSITFAAVATHNHFALDLGGSIFKQSAPVIKLGENASEGEHLELLSVLNSSTVCFWMKQVFQDKGNGGIGGGISSEDWERRYGLDCTKLKQLPIPPGERPFPLAVTLHSMAEQLAACKPRAIVAKRIPDRAVLETARTEAQRLLGNMVAAQEELDWHCLHLYGLTGESLTVPKGEIVPPVLLGERAFEIALARQIEANGLKTVWFERHGSKPVPEIPSRWPEWYRDLVNRRIDLIERDRDVGLIERSDNKRRWARDSWESLEAEALESWLLDRLEDRRLWFEGTGVSERAVCRSVAQLADRVAAMDPDFLDVARLWKGVVEIDPVAVVAQLVADEHVPAQSAARYKGKGFDKRRQWERTWDLQRIEDRGEVLPDGLARIPVPPKYGQVDFAKASYWKQRGKVDVPKERFTSVTGAERGADPTLVLAWAGFDHAEMAQAIGGLLVSRQQDDGWDANRTWPLVVAMTELLPWLAQWHSETDPRMGDSPAGLYRAFTEQQALLGGRTLADASSWQPTASVGVRKKKEAT